MSHTSVIALDRTTKIYGTGPSATVVLHDFQLTIPPGEFLSVMGPSGSGKSTLLNLIAGIDAPTAGCVKIGGNDLARMTDGERSGFRLRRIGYVFQSFNLFASLTVRENVTWPLEFLGHQQQVAERRAVETLDRVGIDTRAQVRRPAELSGGEQQCVAIARALVTDPDILLADEPTGNLDSHTGQAILDLLRQTNLERAFTVVMATHNMFAATYRDLTIELRDGSIVHEARAPAPSSGKVSQLHR